MVTVPVSASMRMFSDVFEVTRARSLIGSKPKPNAVPSSGSANGADETAVAVAAAGAKEKRRLVVPTA